MLLLWGGGCKQTTVTLKVPTAVTIALFTAECTQLHSYTLTTWLPMAVFGQMLTKTMVWSLHHN